MVRLAPRVDEGGILVTGGCGVFSCVLCFSLPLQARSAGVSSCKHSPGRQQLVDGRLCPASMGSHRCGACSHDPGLYKCLLSVVHWLVMAHHDRSGRSRCTSSHPGGQMAESRDPSCHHRIISSLSCSARSLHYLHFLELDTLAPHLLCVYASRQKETQLSQVQLFLLHDKYPYSQPPSFNDQHPLWQKRPAVYNVGSMDWLPRPSTLFPSLSPCYGPIGSSFLSYFLPTISILCIFVGTCHLPVLLSSATGKCSHSGLEFWLLRLNEHDFKKFTAHISFAALLSSRLRQWPWPSRFVVSNNFEGLVWL